MQPGTPKRYMVTGKLFFGSSLRFHNFFDVDNDPEHVTLEMSEAPTEYSAVEAINRGARTHGRDKNIAQLSSIQLNARRC